MLTRRHNAAAPLRCVSALLVLCILFFSFVGSPTVLAEEEETTESVLDALQDEYENLEEKISKSEQYLNDVEDGKKEQKQNISVLESQISTLGSQISVLESRISVLDEDISKLNVSIGTLNTEIDRLSTEIDETESLTYETQRSIDLLSDKIYSRLLVSYMSGKASKLELLVGSKDLYSLFTRLQIIENISAYDSELIGELETQLGRLTQLNELLSGDMATLKDKRAVLSGEQSTLFARQSDIESSAYVLEMKKQLSEYKYTEAVTYFKTLDKSSDDYAAMLKLFSDEQEKIDAKMNAYLLQYGSSADDVASGGADSAQTSSVTTTTKPSTTSFTTVAYVPQTIGSQFTTATTTTTTTAPSGDIPAVPTTSINVVSSSIDLIWPMPYKNCYISAYYGTYPSGGTHRGLDICVRGGTEGKNIVAAGSGRVIQYGFNHWSMGNYIIIDHGGGLFTAYYHMKALYVEQGDSVTQGQIIGLAGNTGNTTGPHLHFEVRVSKNGSVYHTNPLNWVSMPS